MKIEDYKTRCCGSRWYRKGRADYRCEKCNRDITLELVLLMQALEEES